MNKDTENFEQLRRLLRLKRYEQPPPGYFNDFSSRVIARIRLGERGEDSAAIERRLWDAPWLQRIWAAFEAKPVLAGAFGLAMCGFLISSVIYSEKGDVQPVALIPPMTGSAPTSAEVASVMAENNPLVPKPAVLEVSSTNPISPFQFDGPLLRNLNPERAVFKFPIRN